jgi:hypothetical protein
MVDRSSRSTHTNMNHGSEMSTVCVGVRRAREGDAGASVSNVEDDTRLSLVGGGW